MIKKAKKKNVKKPTKKVTKKVVKKSPKKVTKKKSEIPFPEATKPRKKRKIYPKTVQVDMSTMTPLDGSTYLPVTFRHIHG